MNDFNYFPLLDNKKKSNFSGKKIFLMTFGVILIFVLLYGFVVFRESRLQEQRDFLLSIQENTDFQSQYEIASGIYSKIDASEKEDEYLDGLTLYIRTASTANPMLLRTLEKCLTTDALINSIQLSGCSIEIEGECANMGSVAQIEENFRKNGAFSSVFVEAISSVEESIEAQRDGKVQFEGKLVLDGGAILNEEE